MSIANWLVDCSIWKQLLESIFDYTPSIFAIYRCFRLRIPEYFIIILDGNVLHQSFFQASNAFNVKQNDFIIFEVLILFCGAQEL